MNGTQWMQRALELAERGRGFVEPNPLVGAVIVRDGKIVGEGWHQRYGHAHAEVHALNAAGDQARGATLYVTLEPCCHHGKTPPCTDAVLRGGIRRVVAAMLDPFPQVAGRGSAQLRGAGVEVEIGIGGPAARSLNAPYLKLLRAEKPWIHGKWAMTLDGKIATRRGASQWITGETARARVHQLRGRMDAILVGSGTVIADNPLLTARPAGARIPTRVILATGHRDLPYPCRLTQTVAEAPILICTTPQNLPKWRNWQQIGCELVGFETAPDQQLSIDAILRELGRRRMTNVLVEGGAGVLGSFFDANAIDEVHIFIAPKLFGGKTAPGPVGGQGVDSPGQGLLIENGKNEILGEDWLIHGLVAKDQE